MQHKRVVLNMYNEYCQFEKYTWLQTAETECDKQYTIINASYIAVPPTGEQCSCTQIHIN